LAAYSPDAALRHDSAVSSLRDRISRRIQSVAEQLSTPREPIKFDASGTALLTKWVPRFSSAGGAIQLDKVEEDGKQLLHITAGDRGGTASWRTRVFLEGGRYRFEGRARGSGAGRICLRMSGERVAPQVVTGTDWVLLSYGLSVEGFMTEVELVCEFRGSRGEAWFDPESLRLVRE